MIQHRLTRGWRPIAVLALIALVVAGAVFGFHLYPRKGADRIKHMISWDSSCSDVTIESGQRRIHAVRWAGVTDSAIIECEYLGPSPFWARFRTEKSLLSAVRRSPPRDPYCVADREFVSADPLFSRAQFRQLCDDLDGRYSPTPSHAAS